MKTVEISSVVAGEFLGLASKVRMVESRHLIHLTYPKLNTSHEAVKVDLDSIW